MTKNQQVEIFCIRCGDNFKCSPSHAKRRKYCSLNCSNKGITKNTGRTHFKKGYEPWNKGRRTAIGRYSKIIINGKERYEHSYVICSQPENLPYIPEDFEVHHINMVKNDNREENLLLIPRKDHHKIHTQIKLLKEVNK